MRRMFVRMAALALAAGLCGWAAGARKGAADRAALLKMEADFARASAARGVEGWLSYFAPDAAIFPPSADIVTGLPAIRAHYQKTGFTPAGLSWTPVFAEASACGDLGYTFGNWEAVEKDAKGAPVTYRGKFLTVWKRQADGSWKVAADIGNARPN